MSVEGNNTIAEVKPGGMPPAADLSVIADPEALTAQELAAQILAAAPHAPACFTSSFQLEDMVVLHILLQHRLVLIHPHAKSQNFQHSVKHKHFYRLQQ